MANGHNAADQLKHQQSAESKEGQYALYRVGEAARVLGISAATLRLWERQGLITPGRSLGQKRRYSERDLDLLRRIQVMRRVERLSPLAIARLLRGENGHDPRATVGSPAEMAPGIGDRLRASRRQAGLTLPKVAQQVGLSVSFLSAVERGVSGISISALHALVKLYGRTIQDLFLDTRSPGRLVRAGERASLPSPGGVRHEQLATGTWQMEPQYVSVEPGAGSEGSYDHVGEEFVFVVAGSLEIWLEDTQYLLAVGDCLYFPSTIPHRWRNSGREQTQLLWVNTPPTF